MQLRGAEVTPIAAGRRGTRGGYTPHFVNLRRLADILEARICPRYRLQQELVYWAANPVEDDDDKFEWAVLKELRPRVHGLAKVILGTAEHNMITIVTMEGPNEYTYTFRLRRGAFA